MSCASWSPHRAWAEEPADPSASRDAPAADGRERKTHFVSTSAFMLGNLLPEPPNYAQLNYGHRFTDADTLLVEAITWTYYAPLGIPYGPDFEAPQHDYPGSVQGFGVGLAYQRYWWEGLFTTLHATPFLQVYRDEAGEHIQDGFQLFMALRVGYHFAFGEGGWFFVEPSIAGTAWPVITNMPDGFVEREEQWPSFFLLEPGLNFGVSF
jgi:hypothetical protein